MRNIAPPIEKVCFSVLEWMMDEWPPIKCPRFDGETLEAYKKRHEKVEEIVSNFRRGTYEGELAERMEGLLGKLRMPALEHTF